MMWFLPDPGHLQGLQQERGPREQHAGEFEVLTSPWPWCSSQSSHCWYRRALSCCTRAVCRVTAWEGTAVMPEVVGMLGTREDGARRSTDGGCPSSTAHTVRRLVPPWRETTSNTEKRHKQYGSWTRCAQLPMRSIWWRYGRNSWFWTFHTIVRHNDQQPQVPHPMRMSCIALSGEGRRPCCSRSGRSAHQHNLLALLNVIVNHLRGSSGGGGGRLL